ncbi:transposase [Bacillus sp. H-16]|uniref:transposase n=1 Tax=Alteribacter salitolerans TaxID=2912333 RepID=UPI001966B31D|nr:transposase [Alteribacter salitolerans]MBM7096874.1 transposase [Alteribacter salitolerans]
MARKPRQWFPGAIYHIVCRGNHRKNLFFDRKDYFKYFSLLDHAYHYSPYHLHAYCLMTNHLHLLLGTQADPPCKVMQPLNSMYAMYINKKYNLSGHLFQDRYYSTPVASSHSLMKTSAYIHNNPRAAGMVDNPEDYPWSSYYHYTQPVRNTNNSNLIVTGPYNERIREKRASLTMIHEKAPSLLPPSPLPLATEKLTALFPVPSHIHYRTYVEREWKLSSMLKEAFQK